MDITKLKLRGETTKISVDAEIKNKLDTLMREVAIDNYSKAIHFLLLVYYARRD